MSDETVVSRLVHLVVEVDDGVWEGTSDAEIARVLDVEVVERAGLDGILAIVEDGSVR